jgi:serine/threonine protein kinase
MANGMLANYVSSDHYSPDKDCNRLVSNSLVLDRLALRSECLDRTQLCEISCGLVYLHSQKVVHGDIHAVRALDTLLLRMTTNPRFQANIFINIEGRAQVADFGLAVVGDVTVGRLSSMGGAGGHLRYMAPERVSPSSPDSRRTSAADVYSFACICVFVSSPSRSLVKVSSLTASSSTRVASRFLIYQWRSP